MPQVSYETVLEGLETVVSGLSHTNSNQTRVYIAPLGAVTSMDPSTPTSAGHYVKLTEHNLQQARDTRGIAEKYNTRIHTDAFGNMVHLAYQDKESALLSLGVHLQHRTGLSFGEALIIQGAGTHINVAPGMRQLVSRTPVVELLELGVAATPTTDGSMLTSGFDMFDAVERAQMIFCRAVNDDYYLSAEKVLEMTTIDAARCVGLGEEIGFLETGKRADIIVIGLMNPRLMSRINLVETLIRNRHPSGVDPVVVNGEIRLRGGKVVGINEREVLLKTEEEALETTKRVKHLHPFTWPEKKH